MMKNRYSVIVILLIILLSSCVPYEPLPKGIWKSEEPKMLLYIMPDYHIREEIYPGIRIVDGKEVNIVISTGNASQFTVAFPTALFESGSFRHAPDTIIFRGSFRLLPSDELQLTPSRNDINQNRINYESIIFQRLEDYPPINVSDWGQHLENPEVWFPIESE